MTEYTDKIANYNMINFMGATGSLLIKITHFFLGCENFVVIFLYMIVAKLYADCC